MARVMTVGFRAGYLDAFERAGLDVAVFMHGGSDAPDVGGRAILTLPDRARYDFFEGAYDPALDRDAAERTRAAALPLFFRSVTRASHRQQSEPPSWATVHYMFENALNFYARLLRERRVDTVVFLIIPHEGNLTILYHLARALGLRTVVCLQSIFPNAFWIFPRIEDLGLSPIESGAGLEMSYDSAPKEAFYVAGLQKRTPRATHLARIALRRAEVAARAIALQPYWRRYSYAKSVSKLRHDQRLYEHAEKTDAHFSATIEDEPFVYFPLHHQPELSADVIGGPYFDQTRAVEELRRALPETIAIYVKDNPRQTSLMRGPAFFGRIAALPNVKLMRHYVHTIELSRKARAVATITGTAGYEALQMGKPVICFGNAWYRGFPGVFDAAADPDAAVSGALGFRFDDAALRAAVGARSRTLWRGVVNHLFIIDKAAYDEARNRREVSEAIARYLETADAKPTVAASSAAD